ncbi:outer membrane beta-barrel protein [Aquisalimonas sp.]|uniref:outer membrane beta-barrel protein n=1 Tax=Aquisalimonas sp. TaxID=1872621 RepID=UPI0025C5A1CB|nr:outer membrane beta-barrel protein [Aquisalimonas sp.]
MSMTSKGLIPAAFVVLCLPVTAPAAWFGDLELAIAHDDNMNRAARAADERSDTFADVELVGARPFDLREWGTLDAGVVLSGRGHDRFHELNRASVGLTLDFHRRLGLGPQAPWVGAHGEFHYDRVKDDLRKARRQVVGVSAGRGFGDALQVSGGVTYTRQSPRNVTREEGNAPQRVFRLKTLTLSVDVDYLLANDWLLLAGFDIQDGDINASTTDPDLFDSEPPPWLQDPVFGRDFRTYRLDATVFGLHAGLSVPLSPRSSLNVQARYTEVDAQNDISYGATRWRLSYLREL